MYPDDSSIPDKHMSIEESSDLLIQGMDDLEFKNETARINFFF